MNEMIVDGSRGEGGGQILRTSLALAALTGAPLRLANIRAGRAKPGLLRQHLTAARAAAEVCDAHMEGAELGSRSLWFKPGRAKHGRYSFSIGTAGSATLVLQTVLPILLSAAGESEIEVSGGTHNPLAPPFDFLEHVYFPLLGKLGVTATSELCAPGFYPAGGGRLRVKLQVPSRLVPFEVASWQEPRVEAWATYSQIAPHVAERELSLIRAELGLSEERLRQCSVRSAGPGNVVCIRLGDLELVSAFGERGLRAEEVAMQAVLQARRYLQMRAPVGEHLADQLLLVLIHGGGTFTTGPLSSHAVTNIAVVRQFLGEDAVSVTEEGGLVRVSVQAR